MTWDPYLDHLFDEANFTIASTDTGRCNGKTVPAEPPLNPERWRATTLEDAAREALRSLMWAQRRANRLAPGYEHIFDNSIEDLSAALTALALKPIELELENATSSNT